MVRLGSMSDLFSSAIFQSAVTRPPAPADMLVIETPKMRLTGDGPADTVMAGTGDGDRGGGDAATGAETRPVFALDDAVGAERGPTSVARSRSELRTSYWNPR